MGNLLGRTASVIGDLLGAAVGIAPTGQFAATAEEAVADTERMSSHANARLERGRQAGESYEDYLERSQAQSPSMFPLSKDSDDLYAGSCDWWTPYYG